MTGTFTLAVIGSAFGLKGFVKVRSCSGETTHLTTLKHIKLRQGSSEKLYIIEKIMPFAGTASKESEYLLVKFQGIDSPEEAATLTGARFIASRAEAAPLKKDEFYIEDLKGLAITAANSESPSASQEVLGHITDILEGGNGELVELKLLSGEIKLIPFRKEFFSDISLENNRVVLRERWILE